MSNILETKMLKADFHIHSYDEVKEIYVNYDFKQMIDKASSLGFDVLALTQHNKVVYSKELDDYAKEKGIVFISGAEICIKNKHVLILNVKNLPEINDFKDLEKLPDTALVIAAHPFYPFNQCLGQDLREYHYLFDAVEYSATYPFFYNKPNNRAKKFAKRKNIPLVGNSDSHTLKQIGRTYTLVDAEKNIDSIITAVKRGKVQIVTKPLPIITFCRYSFQAMSHLFFSKLNIKKVGKYRIMHPNDDFL
jgi:predicted metal-dependent phosphoesterase TrpH